MLIDNCYTKEIKTQIKQCENLIEHAKTLGATEVFVYQNYLNNTNIDSKNGELENCTYRELYNYTMKIFVEKKISIINANNIDELFNNIEYGINVAKSMITNENISFNGNSDEIAKIYNRIKLQDSEYNEIINVIKTKSKIKINNTSEIDLQISSIECSFSQTHERSIVVSSSKFCGVFSKNKFVFSCITYAQNGDDMQSDYEYFICDDDFFNLKPDNSFNQSLTKNDEISLFHNDLLKGKINKAVNQACLNANAKLKSVKYGIENACIIFVRRVASQFLSDVMTAFNGENIANGISFLQGKLNTQIFSDAINIYDKHFIKGGTRNRLFDSDGVTCSDLTMVANGIIKNIFLNIETANRLKMKTTGHSAITGITMNNVYIQNGKKSILDVISEKISDQKILIVTDVLGSGVNITNCSYVQGVAGFLYENCEMLKNDILNHQNCLNSHFTNDIEIYTAGQSINSCSINSLNKNTRNIDQSDSSLCNTNSLDANSIYCNSINLNQFNLNQFQNFSNAKPVYEMTISGDLQKILREIIPLNDLQIQYGIDSPSLIFDI